MSFAPTREIDTGRVKGSFKEREFGAFFEFSVAQEQDFGPDFPVVVWMTDGSFRFANVKKTVASVVVDEGPDGSPVVEKWQIKQKRDF